MMNLSRKILVLLTIVFVSECQEEGYFEDQLYPKNHKAVEKIPSYSYGYGITDVKTGDVKTAWEAKDGDTVKGHYSVLEADGSMRTVEYTANAETGFQAVVKNEAPKPLAEQPQAMQEKSHREYGKPESMYDYPSFLTMNENEKKRLLKQKYQSEEAEDYPSMLSYSSYLKRLAEEESEKERRQEYSPYKHKGKNNKKESHRNKNKHSSVVEIDLTKQGKYPDIALDDKYGDSSNYDIHKLSPYSGRLKVPKYESGLKHSSDKYKGDYHDLYEYMSASDLSSTYPEFDSIKSKKKPSYSKHKYSDLYDFAGSSFEDDYVLVPKKKYKLHSKIVDPMMEHIPSFDQLDDEDFDHHHHHNDKCEKNKDKGKDIIVKKYIKKKPVINLLDIFDI